MPLPSASISAARSSPTPAWISDFATSTARGDSVAARSAIARAAARASSATSATKPSANARSAEIRRPNSAISLTTGSGSSRASRCVPDQPGTMPTPASGSASVAFGAITRMSQAAASSSPPPKAWPESAAIVGFDSRASRSKIAVALAHPMAGEVERRQLRPGHDVRAGAEGLLARALTITTCTDGCPLERGAMRLERLEHRHGQRVQLGRIVEPQLGNWAIDSADGARSRRGR